MDKDCTNENKEKGTIDKYYDISKGIEEMRKIWEKANNYEVAKKIYIRLKEQENNELK